jgi:hypothetical protein
MNVASRVGLDHVRHLASDQAELATQSYRYLPPTLRSRHAAWICAASLVLADVCAFLIGMAVASLNSGAVDAHLIIAGEPSSTIVLLTRGRIPELPVDLRQRGAAQPVTSAREVDEPQGGWALVEVQHGGERAARIAHGSERRHDER